MENNYKINILGNGKPIITIVGSIHGDESVGKNVINALLKLKIIEGTLILIVGNPLALKKKKRFIDSDLNRCFPGKKNGNFEEKIAFKLTRILKKSDFVIDIHSTTTNVKDLIIIKKHNGKIKKLINLIQPKRVVLMPKGIGDNSLINHCLAGVTFEYGLHESKYTYNRSLEDTKKVLIALKMIKEKLSKEQRKITDNFKVFGVVKKPKNFKMKKSLKNFELIKKNSLLGFVDNRKIYAEEDFYPVLFGEKSYEDIMGFKAKKLNR